MKYSIFPLIFSFLISFSTYSQSYSPASGDTSDSPYKTSWLVDGSYLGISLGLNFVGFKLIQDKEALTLQELNDLSKDDVPGIDRFIAGNYSKRADEISYYPFYGSFAVPVVMMIADKNMRSNAGQISVLFLESMATTGAVYTLTAGLIDRPRPLVYNTSLPDEERTEKGAQRSFIAGHTAATASASFFAAKIYNDFYPDSAAKPYVWTAAALVPAYVGYLRSEAGKHFLTDNIVGYMVGAASGILIPELHKKKERDFGVAPAMGVDLRGNEYQGLTLQYSF
ncbi:phosphatase PAP2 family protein [Salinimicrobium sp. TH3]|uniref:phosphatase PAP2 family protein n=1 Tax=Salinimicrobium sp. TH3 TaxID=2997342 RepID=UPI002275669E|nr:phosphatase PAP2 family protein [Salinimicrobium sp. TH3]MCY2687109.1 phosphatase PAP2 family protein [Salinimicrobium sp. TH3]